MDQIHAAQIAAQVCLEKSYSGLIYIGSGAFKHVFRAKHLEESFALKIFMVKEVNQRTIREVQAMQRCNHPNLAKLIEIGETKFDDRTVYYLVEPFVEGGELQAYIKAKKITRQEIFIIGKQLIDAVGYLKSHDLVHRDIKPSNIIYNYENKKATILDFGLVRDLQATGLTGSWVMMGPGTPLYSSPEQLNNEKHTIDWRSDQFCIGLVLGEMILGHHPYWNGNEDFMFTINRVAERGNIPQENREALMASGFGVISKMIEPWPIGRYRKPEILYRDWSSIEEVL